VIGGGGHRHGKIGHPPGQRISPAVGVLAGVGVARTCPLGDQRLPVRIQRSLQPRRVQFRQGDLPGGVLPTRTTGGLADAASGFGLGGRIGSGFGSSLTAVRNGATVDTPRPPPRSAHRSRRRRGRRSPRPDPPTTAPPATPRCIGELLDALRDRGDGGRVGRRASRAPGQPTPPPTDTRCCRSASGPSRRPGRRCAHRWRCADHTTPPTRRTTPSTAHWAANPPRTDQAERTWPHTGTQVRQKSIVRIGARRIASMFLAGQKLSPGWALC